MYFLYADESGSTNIRLDSPRFFSLTGVLLHHEDIRGCDGRFNALKKEYFNKTGVELKSNQIRRKEGPLESWPDRKYQNFLTDLEDLLLKTNFKIITVVIDIQTYKRKPFAKKVKPIEKAYEILLKRYNNFLKEQNDKGIVVMDSISGRHGTLKKTGKDEDCRMRYIHREFQYMTRDRTQRLNRIIGGLYFTDSQYETGTQIADLCCYPFFFRFEYDDTTYRTFDFLYEKKLYKGVDGLKPSSGIKVYPRNPYKHLK